MEAFRITPTCEYRLFTPASTFHTSSLSNCEPTSTLL